MHKSILFFEAQRAGPMPASNRVLWRGDSGQGSKNWDLSKTDFKSELLDTHERSQRWLWCWRQFNERKELSGQQKPDRCPSLINKSSGELWQRLVWCWWSCKIQFSNGIQYNFPWLGSYWLQGMTHIAWHIIYNLLIVKFNVRLEQIMSDKINKQINNLRTDMLKQVNMKICWTP